MSPHVYEQQLASLYRRRATLDAAIAAFEAYQRRTRPARRCRASRARLQAARQTGSARLRP